MVAKKKSRTKALAERIAAYGEQPKRKRKKKITQEDTEKLIPNGEVSQIGDVPVGTEFRFCFNPDRKGKVVRHTPMGTTIDEYFHVEGYGDFQSAVPRHTAVISSATMVEPLRQRKRRKSKKE